MCKIQRRQGHFRPGYQNKLGAASSAAERREMGTGYRMLYCTVTWGARGDEEFPFWALLRAVHRQRPDRLTRASLIQSSQLTHLGLYHRSRGHDPLAGKGGGSFASMALRNRLRYLGTFGCPPQFTTTQQRFATQYNTASLVAVLGTAIPAGRVFESAVARIAAECDESLFLNAYLDTHTPHTTNCVYEPAGQYKNRWQKTSV
jgi:hypothetical protein